MPAHLPKARPVALALAAASLLLLPAAPVRAMARGPWSMEVLVDGRPLAEHPARGTTYIEAQRGHEYSIRLRNHTSRRVAVALSVDGLNSIDAKTTPAAAASMWILGPYATVTIGGWQTSASTARRFLFTSEEDSYGAWLGRTKNLGVISAAIFEELRREPVAIREKSGAPGRGNARAEGAAPQRQAAAQPNASDDYAATGIGREVGHRVRAVRFDSEAAPAAVMEIRYEYRDALVQLGVLPAVRPGCEDPLNRREKAHGFEGMGFAPDPFARDPR
jgi:hypothetical protein